MGAPIGNKNAAGPHEGGARSGSRADVLRAELKGHRERKDFSTEYWKKSQELDSLTPQPEETHCGARSGSGRHGCGLEKGHAGGHRFLGGGGQIG